MNTIRDEWDSYLSDVVPKDADPIQVQETRRAFYAGARAMQGLLMVATTYSDDAAEQLMQAFENELAAFGKSVGTPQEGTCEAISTMQAGSKPT